jgi:hypothetical protein
VHALNHPIVANLLDQTLLQKRPGRHQAAVCEVKQIASKLAVASRHCASLMQQAAGTFQQRAQLNMLGGR